MSNKDNISKIMIKQELILLGEHVTSYCNLEKYYSEELGKLINRNTRTI